MADNNRVTKRIPTPESVLKKHGYASVPVDLGSRRDPESQEPVGQSLLAISGDAVNEINMAGIARAIVLCLIFGICLIIVFLIVVSVQAAQRAQTS